MVHPAVAPRHGLHVLLLPPELLELLILYSGFTLAKTCRALRAISRAHHVLARLLMIKHGIATPTALADFGSIRTFASTSGKRLGGDKGDTSSLGSALYATPPNQTEISQPSIPWNALVQDDRFDEVGLSLNAFEYLTSNQIQGVAIAVYQACRGDRDYVEVLSEFACVTGSVPIICFLYPAPTTWSHPLMEPVDIRVRDEALVQSAICNRPEIVKRLLLAGADHSANGSAAICMSAKHGSAACLSTLLDFGADTNAMDGFPLLWAARQGHTVCVSLLLDHGAAVSARGGLAVLWAAEHGQLEAMELLIARGGGAEHIHMQEDYALRWASARGHVKVVERLLGMGAAVDAMDNFSLRHAVHFGHSKIVELLCAAGADPLAGGGESVRWAQMVNDDAVLAVLVKTLESNGVIITQ
ncbi:hypothetical protein HK101_003342 [Irineochytrium annulatum]|nr:hypothetical protein HK101_003342 [Irineochytrium annulatum]